jgi:hypothetical protein
MNFSPKLLNSVILALFVAGCASTPQQEFSNNTPPLNEQETCDRTDEGYDEIRRIFNEILTTSKTDSSTQRDFDLELKISSSKTQKTLSPKTQKTSTTFEKTSRTSRKISRRSKDFFVPSEHLLLTAENKATHPGKKILEIGKQMKINGEIVRGGCWDYVNEVYTRAGYPDRSGKRRTVFTGTKRKGPYASPHLIEQGDFVYYVNHSYRGIEHSAIFVDWLDYDRKTALMLSYAGEGRRSPARYLPYDLSNVYRIVRARNH